MKIKSWNKAEHEVWVDSDGDVGIIDKTSYSIMISPEGAKQLYVWLREQGFSDCEHEFEKIPCRRCGGFDEINCNVQQKCTKCGYAKKKQRIED